MAVTSVGLDIGSSAVRAVQITMGGRGPATLDRLGQVLLPPGAVRDGEIVDQAPVVEALRSLWTRYGLKQRSVHLGVANQQVVVRQMDLPYLPDPELRQSLEFQAQDAIPIPIDQAILDFHTLEHYEADGGNRFSRILLVAAQRQMVDTILEVVAAAKLEPVGLDLDAFAMLRSLAPESVLETEGGEMIIDVGASVTNIVVHENGVPRFVRILLMGGAAITDSLVSARKLEWDDAEDLKARTGMSDEYAMAAADDPSSIVTERALRFVDEIRGSLDYYSAQTDSVPVRRAVISGGASQLPGLRERLGETLRMPVDRGHPMQELKIGNVGLASEQLIEAEPYLAVAIGLALGGQPVTARVNLLPREIEEKAKARRTTSWAIGAVAAFAALLGVLYIAKLGDLNGAREERDAAQEVVDQRQADLASLQEFAELDRQLTARNDLLAASMATEISWARVMNDLALTFPPSSSLLTLNATTEDAEQAGLDGGATANPNSESVASLVFDGYSVERFAPGVERVLVKFDEIEAFFNVYLAQANEVLRGDTEVTSFGGTAQLNDNAYTGRYADGLPPEVGQ